MSINLMSAIFRTEFRDLQDNEGNTTKASTAKFVCIALADHANDEGEGAYPSIGKLSYKTSLTRTAIINALDALKHNGIITANGTSKRSTVDYTVNPACFSQDSKPALLVNSIDGGSQLGIPLPVNPVDPNHSLTIHKTSDDGNSSPIPKDLVDGILELSQAPGIKREARINDILNYLGVTFRRNTSTREWLGFAKYIDSEFQSKGWDVKQFVSWLFGQKDYNPNYWPVKKMMEFYPSAFVTPDRNPHDKSFAL